mmetsp:Transcript_19153/g.57841  ORF Transcript_19153/g.57841 Transcript_19153/m.57841 type:complete len:476 (+) Transcript_19153:322-1749(+)
MPAYAEGAPVPTNQAVLRRDIPWSTYMSARLLDDKNLQLIRKFDKKSDDVQDALLKEDGAAYVETFMAVLRNVTKEETVQYVLAHLDNIITADPERTKLFHPQRALTGGPDPYTLFLRLLQRNDWFTQSHASKLLARILNARPDKKAASSAPGSAVSAAEEGVQATQVAYVEWLCSQLRRPSHPTHSVPAVVGDLAVALQDPPMRLLYTRAGGVQLLAPILEGAATTGMAAPPNQQLLYDAGVATWELTFHEPAVKLMPPCGIPAGLVALVRGGVKEKVVRAGLLALKNLLGAAGLDLAPTLLDLGLHKLLALRSLQSWEDDDIPTLLSGLDEVLRDRIQVLSNFEMYKKEVMSGQLDWTPMHTSDQFWRENIGKFEEKDFQVLKLLLKLVDSSSDPRTLAVACHDLGCFIQHFPAGKGIVTSLHGKEAVLRLVGHQDGAVQKQALLASQKILLSRDKADFLANLDGGLAPSDDK